MIEMGDDEDNFSVANKDHFKNLDATFTEILSRIKKAKHPKFLIRVVLAAVDLQDATISENPDASTSFHQIFLHLLSVVSTNILEEIVLESNQSLSRILRLIHSKKLPADLNHVFMDQFCKLEGSEEWIHGFQMLRSKIPIQNWQDLQGKTIWCDFLLERLNSLPMNSKIVDQQPAESKFKVAEMLLTCSRSDIQKLFAFGFIHPDPVFLIPLFSVINSGNQIVRVLKDSLFSLDSNVSDQLSAVFKECQSLQNQVVSSETKDDVWNLQKWFEWLSKDENLVVLLLEKWKTWFKAEKKPTLQNLIVLFAIFNNLDKQRHLNLFFEVLNQFCVEEFETQVLNFHLCHFASSKDLELKNALLLNLPNLKVNDISKQQILRFLYACSETDVWEAAYIATAKLFEKNDWLFNELEFQSMILVPKEHSDSNLVDHKFNLLKLAALTESGEKLIAKVVQFVKTRPDFLVHCVETITNLSKNEMVEIPMLRSLLLPKIRQNEAALAAYCEFLATSVIDAEEFELATECAVELWQLRIHKSE
uniref:Uncharacterized protein n=1 Tax=Panagrolaimus sp. JU765 TaxID=591449 RepID=A0AC34R2X6_9BILA